jgi:hypothetical protein
MIELTNPELLRMNTGKSKIEDLILKIYNDDVIPTTKKRKLDFATFKKNPKLLKNQ